jgi:exodeoxyribonuclease VII large subunit
MRRTLERRRQRLLAGAGKLDALSPLATLRRGYSVALSPEGSVLKRVADFAPGDRFRLRVQDGHVDCEAVPGSAHQGSEPDQERAG